MTVSRRYRLTTPFALLGVVVLSSGVLHALHGDAAQVCGSTPHAACVAKPASQTDGRAPGAPHVPQHSPDDCPICLLIRGESAAPVLPSTALVEHAEAPELPAADDPANLLAVRFEAPVAPRAPPALF
ncbi:MAG: DUF2946 family protein [Phycisphaerae bacterium]